MSEPLTIQTPFYGNDRYVVLTELIEGSILVEVYLSETQAPLAGFVIDFQDINSFKEWLQNKGVHE